MENKVIFLLLFTVVCGISGQFANEENENKTAIDTSGVRFQRILHRKKRFLLFPPGSAIVTTMSFTKTLVPKYPTGINMIAECDIFYPLQTKIADWYPTKPPPPPPPPEEEEEEDDDEPPLPSNIGPMVPIDAVPINPAPPPPPLPVAAPVPQPAAAVPDQPIPNAIAPVAIDPNAGNRLPTDQEIGIMPSVITSDPNYNVGSHPGEVYVDPSNPKKSSKIGKNPPRRFDSFGYGSKDGYYNRSPWSQVYNSNYYQSKTPYSSSKNFQSNTIDESNLWKSAKPIQPTYRVYSKPEYFYKYVNTRNDKPSNSKQRYYRQIKAKNEEKVPSNGHRERRDIFEQFQSFISSKNFNTKDCILRAICETKHYLLPPGKSLFQDIFRVLFTLPLDNDYEDDYTKAMQSSQMDCEDVYSNRCRYSILGYLLSKDRPIL